MIGPLEIAIVVVVLLLIFGYRKLPELGRWAGTGTRELKDSAKELVGDKANPQELAKSAGNAVREARELRDELTGADSSTKSAETESGTETG